MLQVVKALVFASKIYKRASVFSQAMKLGWRETTLNDWRLTEDHTERLQAVSAEQIMFVARKYFQTENMTVAVLDPQPIVSNETANKESSKEKNNAK